jgi:hypothetical protein
MWVVVAPRGASVVETAKGASVDVRYMVVVAPKGSFGGATEAAGPKDSSAATAVVLGSSLALLFQILLHPHSILHCLVISGLSTLTVVVLARTLAKLVHGACCLDLVH